MLKLITENIFAKLLDEARRKERQRSHFNVHDSFEDSVQKLFVAATSQTYFRPHRHPNKTEFALILKGQFEIVLFEEGGLIAERVLVGARTDIHAFEIPQNTWHTWLVKSDDALFFEAKQGPYYPESAAELAPWSPAEGSPDVRKYLLTLSGIS